MAIALDRVRDGRDSTDLRDGEAAIVAALLGVGFAVRLGYVVAVGLGHGARGEAGNAAIGFARYGVISSSYQPDGIASGHFLPIPIVVAGTVYRLLGERTPAAELLLALIAIGLVLGSFYLFHRAFALLNVPPRTRLIALGVLCLLPLQPSLETGQFRIWEGGYAVCLAAATLLLLVRAQHASADFRTIAPLAMTAALLFFVNPLLGVGGYAGILLLTVQQPWRRWLPLLLAFAIPLAALVVPWTIRNERLLGAPVPLRSNFGLELALAYNPAAMTDGAVPFRATMDRIHPFESDAAYRAMRARGGEIPYFRALGAVAAQWIAAHPADATTLALRHVRQFLFPPKWFWQIYGERGGATEAKRAIAWLVSALALVGAAIALARSLRRSAWLYPVLLAAAPTAMSALVQPILRYRYLIFALSVYLAALAVHQGIAALRRRYWRAVDGAGSAR